MHYNAPPARHSPWLAERPIPIRWTNACCLHKAPILERVFHFNCSAFCEKKDHPDENKQQLCFLTVTDYKGASHHDCIWADTHRQAWESGERTGLQVRAAWRVLGWGNWGGWPEPAPRVIGLEGIFGFWQLVQSWKQRQELEKLPVIKQALPALN